LHIYNNIIYEEGGSHTNGRGAIRVYNSQGHPLQNVSIYNNIIYKPNYRYIFLSGGGTPWGNVNLDHNIYYPACEQGSPALYSGPSIVRDENSVYADPYFISENPQEREDFRLRASSPAIDAGVLIPGIHCPTAGANPGQDCVEWYGSAPDIGPYEYIPGKWRSTTAINPIIFIIFKNYKCFDRGRLRVGLCLARMRREIIQFYLRLLY
jgi:hypothetical protein